ncbi:MAG TPA: ECF transporter S component [Anaerolineales bacterium]|nr:ECF transporter S component [Anaerolineales bacterium]
MNRSILIFLGVVVVFFAVVMFVLGAGEAQEGALFNFSTDQGTVVIRFVFVLVGLAIAYAVYYSTKENAAWEVGTRQVVWMAIGAALYAVFSYLFNGTVFVVPSISQVALRPAIVIPMFFGYAFGPVVGFFTGAVGNTFGDALTGFGLSPQWSIGNGLIGFISGCWMLFKGRKESMNSVLYLSGALAVLTAVMYFLFRNTPNMLFFDPENNVFGDAQISLFAGIAIVVGFVLVLAVRYFFKSNEEIATAVTWSMLGNILGLLFASLSDIFINGLTLPATIVGQFLPAAGPNLIFAAILVPLLVVAYASVQRQSGR